MTKYIDLNVGEKSLDHLPIDFALKELLANSIDEHIANNLDPADVQLSYNKKLKTLSISDFGSGIEEKNFIQRKNNKKSDNKYIGKYGIGLKDALVIANDKNHKITIETHTNIFTTEYKMKSGTELITLHVKSVKSINAHIPKGTRITISNIIPETYYTLRKTYIGYYDESEYTLFLSHEIGSIYKFNKEVQMIFVNKLVVNTYSNNCHFSYDFPLSKQIQDANTRDRKDIPLDNFTTGIQQLICIMDVFDNPDITNIIIKILSSNDRKQLKEFNSKDVIRNLIIKFNNTGLYVFVDAKEPNFDHIDLTNKKILRLGKFINPMFGVKNVRNINDHFYTKKCKNPKPIITLNDFEIDSKKIIHVIQNIISEFEKKFNIVIKPEYKKKLFNVIILDSMFKNYTFVFVDHNHIGPKPELKSIKYEPESKSKSKSQLGSKPITKPKLKTKYVCDSDCGSESERESDCESDCESECESEPECKSKLESNTDSDSDPNPSSNPSLEIFNLKLSKTLANNTIELKNIIVFEIIMVYFLTPSEITNVRKILLN